MLCSAVALGVAALLAVPASAMAQAVASQGVVSQGNGRLVSASLLSSSILDTLATLKGANAVNTNGQGDVIVDTPVDASAVAGLIALKVGTTNVPVFGDSGLIRLGAVGQYGRANADGSSDAFSGAVSAAPSLIGVNTVTAGRDVGSPTANSTAELSIGTAMLTGGTDLVNLDATIGTLAASAHESVGGAQSGQYRLAEVSMNVGGTLVSVPTEALRPVLATLIAALNTAGVTGVTNPFTAGGTITVTLADLQAAGLGADLNNLAPDTNLLDYVPLAVINKITALTDGVLTKAQQALSGLTGAAQVAVQLALTGAKAIVTPLLTALTASLQGPLQSAIDALAQLDVNHRSNVAGTFTETALHVGLGSNGALATVDLASAAVGPNGGPVVAPPTTTPTPTPTTTTTTKTSSSAGGTSSETLPRVDG
ncbi:MAG: cell wall anchor protein [Subtercola sp.]|nr:cell wall anchor protein [Subtercola sp.]